MRALDRKLVRDLGLIKGQAIAIAFVIGAGVATFVMSFSNFESLAMTRDAYYGRYRLADVFASLKRAPLSLGRRIERIPGVSRTELRTVVDVTLDVKGFSEPVSGRLISIPEHDRDTLNDLCLRKGRYIEPDRPDEVLVSEGFALAHHLSPGDEVAAVINGRRRKLCLVGIVLSPEYVYSIPPGGLLPDDRRFGVFWMSGKALSAAFDMEGGFNDVALSLTAGAMEKDVIDRLDRVLEPYGGLGAIPRSLQTSNWYLVNELAQLQTMGAVVPVIFLAVAALLLNVVLSRIVSIQREQIAALKALGYSNLSVGAHYSKTGLLIAFVGAAFGTFGGAKMGYAVAENYSQFFRFPVLQYELSP